MTVFDQFRQDFTNKNVLIFGLGVLGRGVGDAAICSEVGSTVRVTDQKTEAELATSLETLKQYPITYTLGHHDEADIAWADIIIRNAGVPVSHPLLAKASELGKSVVMDTDLFVKYATGVTTVGVTGTRGKTTTTTMIYELLKTHSHKQVLLGGNIVGVASLSLLKEITDPANTIAVLELSSWQLQSFNRAGISPNIAVVTNIFPDHLNTYPSMNEYIADKQAIFTHQKPEDHVFLNADQPELSSWADKTVSNLHWYQSSDLPESVSLSVPGTHNRQNAAAALAVARQLGIPDEDSLSALSQFKGVAYRLETIRTVNGIDYINDTTATTPVATITALTALSKPIVLILGGNDKQLPIDELVPAVNERAKKIVLLKGTGTERIKDALNAEKVVGEFSALEPAFKAAVAAAEEGDSVLLSPGFTSFGMFKNEFDRGQQFNALVHTLQ